MFPAMCFFRFEFLPLYYSHWYSWKWAFLHHNRINFRIKCITFFISSVIVLLFIKIDLYCIQFTVFSSTARCFVVSPDFALFSSVEHWLLDTKMDLTFYILGRQTVNSGQCWTLQPVHKRWNWFESPASPNGLWEGSSNSVGYR